MCAIDGHTACPLQFFGNANAMFITTLLSCTYREIVYNYVCVIIMVARSRGGSLSFTLVVGGGGGGGGCLSC